MSTTPIGSKPQVNHPEVMATSTAHRVTPTDGPTFGEVMRGSAQQLLRGASAAVRVLPSGPIVAASVRPGMPGFSVSPGLAPGMGAGVGANGSVGSAEGVGSQTGQGGVADDAVEGALARSQEMNMYLIELQERVAAQNRAFTTYSNVLKAKHDTVKNAINNIR
jgi:hypothetical protein